ncbi:unnamed protein product [Symbiodinium sp. CCMP2592]|nr:unnamed protein product [Symbiodinium sp. CCMP2592]
MFGMLCAGDDEPAPAKKTEQVEHVLRADPEPLGSAPGSSKKPRKEKGPTPPDDPVGPEDEEDLRVPLSSGIFRLMPIVKRVVLRKGAFRRVALQRENQTIGLDFFYFGKLRVLLMMHLGSKYTVSLPAMHLDDPDLLHNINRVIREMGLVGKAVTFRMDQEAALGALAEKLTKCDSSPASATLIDVVPGYRPQSKGSIERQVETMKQGFWSVWMDLEKEVAKVKQETEAVELGKYQLPLGGLLWQACVFYVARCYNLWCTSVGDSSTSIDRLHEEIVNRTRTRPFGCLVQAQVSKSKAHHDKFRGARTVKAVYLGPVHAKGGGIFAVPVGSREIDIFPVARMIQGGDIYDAKTLEELSLAKPLLQDTEDPERPILFDPLEAPGDDAPDEGAGVGMDEDGDEEMIEDELADYSPSEAPENQEVVNDEGDMEIDWLTNHYLESLFRGPDLRATSTAVAKSFDLKFGGTKIRCAVPQNAVSETSGEKLEPDLLYASMKLELEELESFKVGEVIPEREARRLAKENGRRVLTSRWVNTVKKKGLYRSRLVVRDYASMGGTTLSEGIYSPTTSLEGLRLLLSMLCRRGSVLSCDVSVAFMHAPVARAEFVELPNNVSTQGTGERVFVKLRKAMNGLRSAPLSWYCELAEYLRSQNFEASLDPTIFRRLTRKGLTIVLFYVDDLLIYSEDEAEGRRFYEELRKRYKLKLTGELIQDCPGEVSFLGRRIFRRKKGERTVYFGLDEQYLSSCCEEYGITKPAPKLPSLERRYAELLKKGQTELISPAAHERYRRTLGRLAWAALSRPDLQFVCGFLGRHQAAPDEAAETCMRDVLRWVKGLPHKVQRFPSKREILEDDADPASVSCFTDASWSLNSVSGGIITWENCSLKSFSRKQTTTALSSAEAELAALTEVAREGLYIALLVETIREGMPKDRETGYYVLKGYSDSESAVCISKMQTLLRKVRHIELRAAFLQELVARGRFTIEHIPGVINPADALTKSPTNESLSSLYDASGLVDEPKAWESEPTEVHVSFEEPNENERFTPSVPPSWKAAALKLARGEAKYVVVELCCEEGSALSKACSKVPEIAYFGVTKEVDLLSYNGLHLRFKKGGKALEKWRAALAVHKRSWKRIEKLLEPYVGSPNLLLSHEWPERCPDLAFVLHLRLLAFDPFVDLTVESGGFAFAGCLFSARPLPLRLSGTALLRAAALAPHLWVEAFEPGHKVFTPLRHPSAWNSRVETSSTTASALGERKVCSDSPHLAVPPSPLVAEVPQRVVAPEPSPATSSPPAEVSLPCAASLATRGSSPLAEPTGPPMSFHPRNRGPPAPVEHSVTAGVASSAPAGSRPAPPAEARPPAGPKSLSSPSAEVASPSPAPRQPDVGPASSALAKAPLPGPPEQGTPASNAIGSSETSGVKPSSLAEAAASASVGHEPQATSRPLSGLPGTSSRTSEPALSTPRGPGKGATIATAASAAATRFPNPSGVSGDEATDSPSPSPRRPARGPAPAEAREEPAHVQVFSENFLRCFACGVTTSNQQLMEAHAMTSRHVRLTTAYVAKRRRELAAAKAAQPTVP